VCSAQQQRLGSDKAEVQSHRSVKTAYLDEMDRVCLLTAVLLVTVCLIVAIVLHKYTSRCHFKAGLYHLPITVVSVPLCY